MNDLNKKQTELLSACKRDEKRDKHLFGGARGKFEHGSPNMRKLDFGDLPKSAADPEVFMASPDKKRKVNQENDIIE